MAKCDTCGNDYDKSFRVTVASGKTHMPMVNNRRCKCRR